MEMQFEVVCFFSANLQSLVFVLLIKTNRYQKTKVTSSSTQFILVGLTFFSTIKSLYLWINLTYRECKMASPAMSRASSMKFSPSASRGSSMKSSKTGGSKKSKKEKKVCLYYCCHIS